MNTELLQKMDKVTATALRTKVSRLETQVESLTVESAHQDEQLQEKESELQKATATLSDKTLQIGKLERKIETMKMESSRNEMSRINLNKQLQDVYRSKSWKITLPLRKLLDWQILLQGLPKRLRNQVFLSKPNKSTSKPQNIITTNQRPPPVSTEFNYPDTADPKGALSFSEQTPDFDEMLSPDAITRVSKLIHKGTQN